MILVFALIGILTGALAGCFGIGGGIIMVPLIAELIELKQLAPAENIMHIAIASSLATMCFTSAIACRKHFKLGNCRTDILTSIIPGTILGAIVGSYVAHYLHSDQLTIIFAAFLLFMSWRLLNQPQLRQQSTKSWLNLLAGFFSAAIGGILGIGGGIFMVPYLLNRGLTMPKAVGTAAVATFTVAVCASLNLLRLDPDLSNNHAGMIGYFYWPGIMGLIFGALVGVPLGVKAIQTINPRYGRMAFAGLLLLVALRLILRVI